jgi:hypothetical protein
MTKEEYWKIVDELNWKKFCENKEERPYDLVCDIILDKYPKNIVELRTYTEDERVKLGLYLSTYGIGVGNDSGWDLTAHIIGCGLDYLNEVEYKVNSGVYTYNNIYQEINYRENFQYSFGRAMEKLVEREFPNVKDKGTGEDLYKAWLRGNKIDELINQ